MKIIENNEPTHVAFDSLRVRDVFKIKNDTKYYMKTETYESIWQDPFDGGYFNTYRNTICLSNGAIMKTDKNTKVIPVDCELIIK